MPGAFRMGPVESRLFPVSRSFGCQFNSSSDFRSGWITGTEATSARYEAGGGRDAEASTSNAVLC